MKSIDWLWFVTTIAFAGIVFAQDTRIDLRAPSVAVAAEGESYRLCWTAPGDDGNVGIAAQYDIRYSTDSITEENWDWCMYFEGEPAPETAGTTQCFPLPQLPEGWYFAALKAADEVPNWSPLSNVVRFWSALPADTTVDDSMDVIVFDCRSGSATMVRLEYWTTYFDSLDATAVRPVWSAPEFVPGDVNLDGKAKSSDIIWLISYVFKGGPAPPKPKAPDVRVMVGPLGEGSPMDTTLLWDTLWLGDAFVVVRDSL